MAPRATLVLLPGMEGSGIIYGPLVEAAPPGVELVSVTYPAGAANGYDDLMPLVRAVLPRGRPFHLLGWSFSGPLALRIAAEHPPGLRGVVLASSFVRRPSWVPTGMHRLARPWLFKLYPPAAQVKALLGRQASPELRRLLREAHALAGAEALAGRVRAAMTIDAREALRACVVPILYLRATHDEVIRARCADEVRALAPATEVVDLPGSHLTLVAAPAAAWAALLPFLERTLDGGAPPSS